VGSGQGAIIVEKDDLVLRGLVAYLQHMSDGELGQRHAVVKLFRDPPELVHKAQSPVGSRVLCDISEKFLMVALSRVFGHCDSFKNGIGKLARVPRVDNNRSYKKKSVQQEADELVCLSLCLWTGYLQKQTHLPFKLWAAPANSLRIITPWFSC